MDIMAEARNLNTLMKFRSLGLMYLVGSEESRHIDVGHNKPHHLRIMQQVAQEFPNAKFVYYDNSTPEGEDIDSENINQRKAGLGLGWFAGMYGVSSEKIGKRKLMLPKNLRITRSPKGEFDAATYMWTLHEFEQGAEASLREIYGLLRKGGRIGILDYTLGALRDLPVAAQHRAIKRLFDSGNESVVLVQEGISECIRMHSQYTPESLAALVESVGFVPLSGGKQAEYRKFEGRKYPKSFMGFWKKE